MGIRRCFVLIMAVVSIFAVKVGSPGESVHINGTSTGVGVDTTEIPEAFFEVRTDEGGILIPRLTISQRDGISAPSHGLMIYNTDCELFNYYNGTSWIPFPNLDGLVVGPVTGSTSVCEDAIGVGYSIPAVSEATDYEWSLPDGATIASGSGTESITVDFGTDGGRVCVLVHTECGTQGDCMIVGVTTAPVGGTVTGGGTISYGESTGTLTLSGHSGTIDRWQKRHDGAGWSDITETTNTYSEIPTLVGVWDYRAVVVSTGCPEVFSDYATVTVEAVTGDSTVFNYTGSVESWTVPAGISTITIKAWGAEGGSTAGGNGAYIEATVAVTPGSGLSVFVGGAGGCCTEGAGGGGDASYVGLGTTPLVIAAGGGGGRPNSTGDTYYAGGAGSSSTVPTLGARSSTGYGWGSISSGGNGGGAGSGAWGSGGGGGWYTSGTSGSGSSGGTTRCRGSDQYSFVGGAGGGYNGGPGADMDSGWGIAGGGGGGSYYTGTLVLGSTVVR